MASHGVTVGNKQVNVDLLRTKVRDKIENRIVKKCNLW